MKTITQSASKWLLLLILAIYPLHSATGSVIYVDVNATGANNGSSWANAHKYLQDALNTVGSGNEIWVAQGTYRPDKDTGYPGGTNDRTATFPLINNVALYGGFPTGGGNWASRNFNTHETILSGDINVPDNNSDNSYHVVTGYYLNSTAILDGFTITDGNEPSVGGSGAGMTNVSYSNPTITNCTFSGNSAYFGGGMYNCWFSSPTVTNCIFIGNFADGEGGGMWNICDSNPTLTNCTFSGNSSNYGGVMWNVLNSNPTLTNCTFNGNLAYGYGGVMYSSQESSPTLINCTFSGNSAEVGSVIFDANSSPTLTNCILWNNTGGLQIYHDFAGILTVSYCDVQGGWEGTGNIDADPLFVDADGFDNVFGTIDDDLRMLSGSPCIDAGDNNAVPGGVVTDLDGRSRFKDDPATGDTGNGTPPIVDMGAYEYGIVIYVDANATGANDGTSWEDAYKYLQNALWAAEPNYEIWVAQGTYRPDENDYEPNGNGSGSRYESFNLINGVAIYGGFPSGGGNWASRDPNLHQTILSGDLDEDDANVSDPCNLLNEPTRAENSYHVVTGSNTDATAILDGFTIRAGNANSGSWPNDHGGGMLNVYANCKINKCTFVENSSGSGGAIHNNQSESYINNCVFYRNSASGSGGGLEYYHSNHPTLSNCTFICNVSSNGGGVSNGQSNPDMNKCSFSNNIVHSGSGGGGGGGISNINWSSPTITDCNFIGNSALYGGGINDWNSTSTTVTNCTFTGNSATSLGGGVKIDKNCYVMLTKCNFSGNTSGTGKGLFSYDNSIINIGTGGNNSISDEFYIGGSSEVQGTGSLIIGLGGEMIVDGNAIADLSDPCYPGAQGTIQCDGLLKVKGSGLLQNADVNITRQTGGIYGKFVVEDNAQVTNLDIFADGDRFMDVNYSTFTGTIANNRIYVTITEGQNGMPEGILEVRGLNFGVPPCGPNQVCQISSGNMPDFNTNSWTLERLELAPGARLNLVDRFSSGNGTPEVLYVKNLALGADSNLSVGFEHLYYANISGDGDSNSIVKVSLFGFSLGDIDSDSNEEFASRVSNNNYIDPVDPYNNKIYVERVTGLEPDPNGMMKMSNLKDSNEQLISARAKGEFAPVTEDEIRVRLDYLFTTTDPNTYIAVYLSDVPELGDLNDSEHYKEVARIPAPPYPRPGSAGSGRFGNFEKFVSTFGLDLTLGTWVELVLVEPQSQILKYGIERMGYAPMAGGGGGAIVFTDDWDAGVYCYYGICLDLDWSGEPDIADFLIVISGSGGDEPSCADGSFSGDGYEDSYDSYSWDWTINLENRLNMCGFVPLRSGGSTFAGVGGFGQFGGTLYFFNPSDLNNLLISGKRGTTDEPTKIKDRHYIFDSNYHYLKLNEPSTENRNIRVVRGTGNDLYQINSKTGISRLEDNGPVVPCYATTFTNEPRYNRHSTVYIGIQGTGDNSYGRPLLDAAFDTKDANYVYVVPVVVIPDCNDPYDYNLPYTAAARVRLTPPYDINKLYDGPLLAGDNQRQYRNNLREIECDGAGNVFVTNANSHNASDILWKFEPNGVIRRLELDPCDPCDPCKPCVRAPVGLCASGATDVLYVASALYNSADPNSQKIYGFSTADLNLVRTITVHKMQHVTSIAEDPVTRALWITGFNMNCTPPKRPSPIASPFYDPYLAKIPQGVNDVCAVCILDANHAEYDLAMPLSIVWTGSRQEKCGGADLDKNGQVNFQDFAKLAQYWLSGSCVNLNNCGGADLEPEVFPDGDVDLRDFDSMAEYWLDTGCQ